MPRPRARLLSLLAWPLLALGACNQRIYDPARAMPAYPRGLHTEVVDMHVFRSGDQIEIVNTTAHSYRNVIVWVNRRYGRQLDELPAGGSTTMTLRDFYDARGEVIPAGGFFRIFEPTPVRLVELQVDRESLGTAMVGLVAIRAEDPE